jgi:predicted aconitase
MNGNLRLTAVEQQMLAGAEGPGVKKAMEIVVALGRIYGARDLVPVTSAQISGVSFKNLGDSGLEFLREWASQGARVRVPAMLNPAGMDRLAWRELGFPEEFAGKQEAVLRAYVELGVQSTCTCTPYLVGYLPEAGDHLAWAESSAVSYANSVLGARSNREGGPSALAAAITGRTARYGLHLEENRAARVAVDVRCPLATQADYGALGFLVGRSVADRVPLFRFQRGLPGTSHLPTLGAAMAASGAVALFHVEGLTPEARTRNVVDPGAQIMAIDNLETGYRALNSTTEAIDLVSLGCPHASLPEIEAIAAYLEGRRVRSALWITTARTTRERAETQGVVERIEAAGGRVVADTCMVVAPAAELGFRTLATNSAKMALYAPSHSGLSVRFGSTEQCLDAAVSGRWPIRG